MTEKNAKSATRGSAAQIPEDAGAIADALKTQAQDRSAVGRHVTLAQRRLRDSAIIAAMHAGAAAKDVAKDFEITPRHVRRVMTDFNSAPSALDKRPMELLEEFLRGYRRLIADFEAMADYYRDTHPNVALGAKRSAVDTRERMQTLLETTGKLPDNLELFRSEMEMRRVGELMVDKLAQVANGELSAIEAQEFFYDLLRPAAPLWDVPPGDVRELSAGSPVDEAA